LNNGCNGVYSADKLLTSVLLCDKTVVCPSGKESFAKEWVDWACWSGSLLTVRDKQHR